MTGQQEQPTRERLIPLLAIVGPTAAGKTKISVSLAQKLNGEIVSADSVQVYRYLNIGSAKPSIQERKGVPHHLIDIVDPDVSFTVYDYQRQAQKVIQEIDRRNKLPILTGGTGLYIKAVLDNYHFNSRKTNTLIRKRLSEELALKGKEDFYQMLQQVDPPTAEKVHPNDSRRILRALEFFYLTGEPISQQRERTKKKTKSFYRLTLIGLSMPRNVLYETINNRAEQMIQNGFLTEVKQLLDRGYDGDLKALQSLGYYHLVRYLDGKWDWETTISTFKRDTRRYAKRQLTWFRADKRVNWYTLEPQGNTNHLLDQICSRIEGY